MLEAQAADERYTVTFEVTGLEATAILNFVHRRCADPLYPTAELDLEPAVTVYRAVLRAMYRSVDGRNEPDETVEYHVGELRKVAAEALAAFEGRYKMQVQVAPRAPLRPVGPLAWLLGWFR